MIEVDKPEGQRFKAALEWLREGKQITYRGIGIGLAPNGVVECRIESSFLPENLTKQFAEQDAENAEAAVKELIDESPEFADIVHGRKLVPVIIHASGMGAIELCRREDGKIVGMKNYKD